MLAGLVRDFQKYIHQEHSLGTVCSILDRRAGHRWRRERRLHCYSAWAFRLAFQFRQGRV